MIWLINHAPVWLIVSHRQGQTGSKYHSKDRYNSIRTIHAYYSTVISNPNLQALLTLCTPDPTPKKAPPSTIAVSSTLPDFIQSPNQQKNLQLTQFSRDCLHNTIQYNTVPYICTSHVTRVTRSEKHDRHASLLHRGRYTKQTLSLVAEATQTHNTPPAAATPRHPHLRSAPPQSHLKSKLSSLPHLKCLHILVFVFGFAFR